MIEIDGSLGEGGGQILRTTVALAAALQKEVRINKIRAGRSEPGIKAQHLAGVRAAAQMCDATVEGAEVGSGDVIFRPGRLKAGKFRFDVGTAGSVSLVLQTLMPLGAFLPGKVELELVGGTDVKWSPPIDYLRMVVLPVLESMKYTALVDLQRRGHYPRGGGFVRFTSNPVASLAPINGRVPGAIRSVSGISHAVGLPRRVAQRQAESARRILSAKGLAVDEIVLDVPETSQNAGSGVVLWAGTENGTVLGGDCVGEKGKPAEEVGAEAAQRLVEEIESHGFLDSHMGDMVVPYMALAKGVSEVTVSRITQHCLTNLRIAEQLAGVRFEVLGELGKPGLLRTMGLGLEASAAAFSPREPPFLSHL